MKQIGIDIEPVRYDTCCEIAGTFGFKKSSEGYDVSMAIGERFFERIRAMNIDLAVTESTVGKMQIEHGASIRALDPATALWGVYQRLPGTCCRDTTWHLGYMRGLSRPPSGRISLIWRP